MSIRYKTKEVQILDKVLCDMCAMNCTQEYASLTANWGYYSNKDESKYLIHFCENCFDRVISWISKNRNPSIYTTENDPLKGNIS